MSENILQFRASLGDYSERDLMEEIGMQSAHQQRYRDTAKTCSRGTQGKRTQIICAWQCRERVRWARAELARMRRVFMDQLTASVFGK